MTIKQQGGIFGRNPTFNNVEVEGDLTVAGSTVPDPTNLAKLDTANTFTQTQTIANGTPILELKDTDGPYYSYIKEVGSNMELWAKNGNMRFRIGGDETEYLRLAPGGDLQWYEDTGTSVKMLWDASTEALCIANGVTLGNGTTYAAGNTLDDYEEGTWTPIYAPASGAFGSITYDTGVTGGRYTKVGNLVHIQGGIRTDAITVGTASGGIRLGGLPFAAIASGTGHNGWSTLTIGQASAFAGDVPSAGSVVAGQSYFELQYRSAANGATIDLAVADLDTGADDNLIRFSATYIAG